MIDTCRSGDQDLPKDRELLPLKSGLDPQGVVEISGFSLIDLVDLRIVKLILGLDRILTMAPKFRSVQYVQENIK